MRNLLIRFLFLALVVAVLCAAAGESTAATGSGILQGRVLFEAGGPPPGPAANDAVVYLIPQGSTESPQPVRSGESEQGAGAATLDQKDLTFVPHVLPVLAGSEVLVRNSDETLHNVHTRSSTNKAFNVAQLPHGSRRVTFPHPEVIPVACDIHSQMRAYILVLDTPHFVRPGKDGGYVFRDIPPGRYTLHAWHEEYGAVAMPAEVQIVAGQTAEAEVKFTEEARP